MELCSIMCICIVKALSLFITFLFSLYFFFFFNDTATTEIYTLSLHDALPISSFSNEIVRRTASMRLACPPANLMDRSEEHTSELQSHSDLVCRLLLEKKKKRIGICMCQAINLVLTC